MTAESWQADLSANPGKALLWALPWPHWTLLLPTQEEGVSQHPESQCVFGGRVLEGDLIFTGPARPLCTDQGPKCGRRGN